MTKTIKSPPWRVGVDVGGTFTDLVVADSDGRTEVYKVPSVPADPGEGVIDALLTACASLNQPIEKFLGNCQFFFTALRSQPIHCLRVRVQSLAC